jgi:hypothetical protein
MVQTRDPSCNDRRLADPSAQEIADGLRLFIPADQVIEIRILKAGRAGTVSGYFDDLKAGRQILRRGDAVHAQYRYQIVIPFLKSGDLTLLIKKG